MRYVKIRRHERGLVFRDREFTGVLRPGRHLVLGLPFRTRVDVVSVRDAWLAHPELDVIARSGALGDEARVLDLAQHERALVWVDGRLQAVLSPGLFALWTVFHRVEVEVIDARATRLVRDDLPVLAAARGAPGVLEMVAVEPGHVGLFFRDGQAAATLPPGTHGFWKGLARVAVVDVDLREQVLDVSGQEVMTADKVTLRLNAVATFQVADPLRAVAGVEDHRQALYREAQLALRAAVGARELDVLLADKDALSRELHASLAARASALGVNVLALGIRDVILPGEMKDLMNKVTEARKAAEANLITRREETAAMRSQANTARLLETSPTLMRLRELEALERVAEKAKLSVVLGDQGLSQRLVKMI